MPKSSSLAIAVLAKEWVGIAIAKASMNGTIDNIQFPLFFGIPNANAIAQCEWTLSWIVTRKHNLCDTKNG